MKSLWQALRVSVIATVVLGILVSFIYPVVVWGLSQVLFHDKANGSLLEKDGKIVGSALLGQSFTSPQYFQSRPSAAGKGYDASSSGGSNFGPISEKLLNDAIKARVQSYREINHLGPDVKIPADAVTASASGLDPHISPQNADLQVPRIAGARGLNEEMVRKLVANATEYPDLGILGEPGVNVLKLNLALDKSK